MPIAGFSRRDGRRGASIFTGGGKGRETEGKDLRVKRNTPNRRAAWTWVPPGGDKVGLCGRKRHAIKRKHSAVRVIGGWLRGWSIGGKYSASSTDKLLRSGLTRTSPRSPPSFPVSSRFRFPFLAFFPVLPISLARSLARSISILSLGYYICLPRLSLASTSLSTVTVHRRESAACSTKYCVK